MPHIFHSELLPKRASTILNVPMGRLTPGVSSCRRFLIEYCIVLLSWISSLGNIHASTTSTASDTPIAAGTLDLSLPPITISGGSISLTIPLENGGILIGGSFTTVNGVTRNRIARLSPDGSLDLTFNPSFDGAVNTIHVFSDGSMLIAGQFTTLGGVNFNRIVKLNPDGKPDPLFVAGTDNAVTTILARPDGKIIIGGSFRSVNNVSRSYLARLNTNGSLDSTFNPAVTSPVSCLASQGDGKIMVGGSSSILSGSSIARLESNGTRDTSFTCSSIGAVASIVVAPDGKILIGGSFTTLNGVNIRNIARLTASGSIDTTFVATATGGTVSSINLQANGKLVVGGSFTSINDVSRNRFGRLNSDGSLDGMNPLIGGSLVSNMSLQSDGKLLLVGALTTVNGVARASFARLIGDPVTSVLEMTDPSTVRWVRGGSLPLESSVSFEIHEYGAIGWRTLGDAEPITDGWTLGGLSLPTAGIVRVRAVINTRRGGHHQVVWLPPLGSAEPRLMVRDSSGRQFQSTVTTANFSATPIPLASEFELEVLNTGLADLDAISVAITGPAAADYSVSMFPTSKLQPTAVSSIKIRFNPAAVGTRLAQLSIGSNAPGLNPFVIPLIGSGGSVFSPLFVSETDTPFTASSFDFNGINFGSLVLRFAPSPGTSLIAANNTGANPISGILAGLPDQGMIEAAFEGTTYRFITTYRGGDGNDLAFVLLSPGSVDPCFNPRVNSTVFALGLQKDGKIIAAGGFSSVGGVPRNRIARLNQDGTRDNSFIPALTVRGIIMLLQRDGRIIVESSVTDAAGIVRSTLGRMNTDGSIDTSFSTRISGSVFIMMELRNGSILLGGNFSSIGTTNKFGIALLNSDGSLNTNFTTWVETGSTSVGSPTWQVKALAELPDGKILIGGNFLYVNGSERSFLARLNSDGSLDSSFDGSLTGPSFGEVGVTCLVVQPDNRIIVGGYLTGVAGSPRNRILRLNANGSVDPSFLASVDRQPECILLLSDGSLILGGPFSEVNGVKRNHLAKLNAGGSLDEFFKPNQVTHSATIWSILMERNGSILVGGSFSSMNGVGSGNLARLAPLTGTSSLVAYPSGEIIWQRRGAQADLQEVDMEFTGDQGRSWTGLGQATRTPEGWRLAGQLPSPQGIIRACGFQNLSNRSFAYTVESALFGRDATSIEQWRKLYFGQLLAEGLAADLADADGDGLQNLMEFALGMDPRKDSSGLSPRWVQQGTHYGMEFQKPLGADGVDYAAEWSPTMAEGTWQPAEDVSSDNTIRFRVPGSGHPYLFFRLKAIAP